MVRSCATEHRWEMGAAYKPKFKAFLRCKVGACLSFPQNLECDIQSYGPH